MPKEPTQEQRNILMCDLILFTTIVTMPAIRNAQRCLNLFRSRRYPTDKIKVVINRYIENDEIKIEDIEFLTEVCEKAKTSLIDSMRDNVIREDNFVRKMNLEASKIGCKNTNFINCTGLPENNHYTTCYDMALIAKSLLNNYEDTIIPFTKTYEE